MQVTTKQLKLIAPKAKKPAELAEMLSQISDSWGINTPARMAMFIAQCAHESAEFTVFSENLNYSESALLRVFKKYFTVATARDYARQPELIANRVYANRMGNGDEQSGDGWKYRGGGAIQLTGHNNFKAFAADIGLSIDEAVDAVRRLPGALEAAMWFWEQNDLNRFADKGDVLGATKAINGGTHGITQRQEYYARAVAAFEVEQSTSVDPSVPAYKLLTAGSKGELVRAVQHQLGIAVDGFYGPETKRAVKAWQQSINLTADGVFGKNSYRRMFQ